MMRSPWLLAAALVMGALLLYGTARRARRRALPPLLTLLAVDVVPFVCCLSRRGYEMLREGGTFVVPVLVAHILAAAAILSLTQHDETEGRGAALLPLALAPLAIGLAATRLAYAARLDMLDREPRVSPNMRPYIEAYHQSETLAVLIMGFGASAILCILVARPRAMFLALRALFGGVVVMIASAVVGGAGASICAALMISAEYLVTSEEGVGSVASTELRGVVATGCAALLVAMGAIGLTHRQGFDMLAGSATPRAQWLGVLVEMLHRERVSAVAMPFVVGAALLAAGWSARRAGVRRLGGAAWRSLLPGLAALSLLLAAAGWLRAWFDARLSNEPSPGSARVASVRGSTLPTVDDFPYAPSVASPMRFDGLALGVTSAGALVASERVGTPMRAYDNALAAPKGDAAPLLVADAKLRFDALMGALAPVVSAARPELRLVAQTPGVEARGAEIYRAVVEPYVGTIDVGFVKAFSLVRRGEAAPGPRRRVLGVIVADDWTRSFESSALGPYQSHGAYVRGVVMEAPSGSYDLTPSSGPLRVPVRFRPYEEEAAREKLRGELGAFDEVLVACAPSTDVETLARTLLSLADFAGRDTVPALTVTADVATLGRAAAEAER
jgi:hypothetical protein